MALYSLAGNLKKFTTPDSEAEKALQALYGQLSAANLKALGWLPRDTDSNDDTLARPYVLSAALYSQDPKAQLAAHEQYEAHVGDLINLPADVRVFILSNEMQNFGTATVFNQLLNDYRTTADASYRRDLAQALTKTKDAGQIATIVAAFEDADTVKPQDLRAWFAGVLANPAGQQAAWDWFRNSWGWLNDTVGGDMEFPTYITVISRVFHTQARLAEFTEFFTPKRADASLTREIDMDTSVIAGRVALINAEADSVNAAVAEAIQ